MNPDYLDLDIKYDLTEDKFVVGGEIGLEGQVDLIDTFLREQVGKGEDKTKPNEQRTYHLRLR